MVKNAFSKIEKWILKNTQNAVNAKNIWRISSTIVPAISRLTVYCRPLVDVIWRNQKCVSYARTTFQNVVFVFLLNIFNISLKASKSVINDILMFTKHLRAVLAVRQIAIIDFWKIENCHFLAFFDFDFYIYDESIDEPFRQWLGWQTPGGSK